jgi:phage FluMu gp28-like protein
MSGILHPYQRRWVDDDSRFKAGMFARQTGKTFSTTLEIAEDILDHDIRKQRTRWVILSRGERQAKEAMDEGLKLHLRGMGAGFDAFVEDSGYRYEDGSSIKAQEVILKHGSRVTALPANPDTARGFSANVFLDEFAFHADSRKIWSALFPVISKPGLKLRVVSTPNGKGNKFYELMTDAKLGAVWSRHMVDIYQAVADGLPRDVDELRSGLGDPDGWAQEYELKWLDEASAWLSYDLIGSVEHERAGIPENYTGGPCFVGVDIGIRGDLFVIYVLEKVGDVLWEREEIARKRISFAEQDALLDDVFRRYHVVACRMDQTGMGEKPVEDAKRRHGQVRVQGVLFNPATKLYLATIGKEAFDDKLLRIRLGDPELRNDLHKLRREATPTGAPRFVAESDSAGHADRAWACFLALAAADSGQEVFAYEGVSRRGADPDHDNDRPVRATAGFSRGII